MNLFNLANQNSKRLKQKTQVLKKDCETRQTLDVFNEFIKTITEHWTISINMKPYALNKFLLTGKYKNIHEIKNDLKKEIETAGKETNSVEEALKKHLKTFSKMRIIFDKYFDDGEKFRYAALNNGGLGLTHFGPYCLVFDPRHVKKYTELAFIKEDSLNYVDGEKGVKIENIKEDLATKDSIHYLAILKHEKDYEKILPEKWASMICSKNCNIEAITTNDLLIDHIKSVRISKKENQIYYKYLLKDFTSELSTDEKYRLAVILTINRLLEKQGIETEEINDGDQ